MSGEVMTVGECLELMERSAVAMAKLDPDPLVVAHKVMRRVATLASEVEHLEGAIQSRDVTVGRLLRKAALIAEMHQADRESLERYQEGQKTADAAVRQMERALERVVYLENAIAGETRRADAAETLIAELRSALLVLRGGRPLPGVTLARANELGEEAIRTAIAQARGET